MAKILTEQEVAAVGGKTTSNPKLCCTAARASALNCNVTSPSGAASNQLITGVSSKGSGVTVTGSYTTYRNVSVGTSTNPDGDIPRTGGSRRALATVTYLYATVTTYSNGTSTTGAYSNGSAVIYGSYVTASGVTETTARTYIGSSTPSGTVAGATRTGSAVSIYRAAYTKPVATYNYKVSYSNHTGKTSPAVNLYISGSYAGTLCSRFASGNRTTEYNWSKTGTVTSVTMAENGGKINYMTIVANGTTVLNKLYIGNASSQSYKLSRSFNTSSFMNGLTISISFSDS